MEGSSPTQSVKDFLEWRIKVREKRGSWAREEGEWSKLVRKPSAAGLVTRAMRAAVQVTGGERSSEPQRKNLQYLQGEGQTHIRYVHL
jgi:hypothetical protein